MADDAGRLGPRRTLRIYLRLVGQELKTLLAYRADAILLLVSSVLQQALALVVIVLVLANVPVLEGWSTWEAVLLYSFIPLSDGIASLLTEGVWMLGWYIFNGDFDRLLVRPYPLTLQVFAGDVSLEAVTNLLGGSALLTAALVHEWGDVSGPRLLVLPLLLVSATAIRIAINLFGNSLGFWFVSQSPMPAYTLYGASDLGKFPLEIYPAVLKYFLVSALPLAFVSYYPAVYLLGKSDSELLPLLGLGVAAAALTFAVFVFRRGVRRYESVGA